MMLQQLLPSTALRFRASAIVSAVTLALVFSNTSRAQEEDVDRGVIQDGELHWVAPYTRHLIKLELEGDRLALQRDWSSPLQEYDSDEELLDRFLEDWVRRGKSEEESLELAEMRLTHHKRSLDRKKRRAEHRAELGRPAESADWISGLSATVDTLLMASPNFECGSGGDRGNGTYECQRHSSSMLLTANVSDQRIHIGLRETDSPFRSLEVDANESGRLSVTLTADSYLVDFLQDDEGQCRFLISDADGTRATFAKDFSTLIDDNPAVVHRVLLPIWDHCGIDLPMEMNPELDDSIKETWATADAEWPDESPAMDDGVLSDISDQLKKAFDLKLVDGHLKLDREWKEFGGHLEPDELIEEMKKQYKERMRVSDEVIDAMFERTTADQWPPTYSPAFKQAMLAVMSEATAGSRRGNVGRSEGGSTGGKVYWRFDNPNLITRVTLVKERIAVRLEEVQGDNRTLRFRSSDDGFVATTIVGEDFVVDIRQQSSGAIQIVHADCESYHSMSASSWSKLTDDHPAEYTQWLVPLLEHYGLSPTAEDE